MSKAENQALHKTQRAYLLFPFILIYLFQISASFAQQPIHWMIGEDELSEMDIYDIRQDAQANIWLTTETGLFRYDGYEYKHYPNPELKNTSLFSMVFDEYGTLFTCNLAGQILYVKEDSLQEYFQVPDSLLARFISMRFDNKNTLWISSQKIITLNSNKELQIIPQNHNTIAPNYISKTEDGQILTSIIDKESLLSLIKRKPKAEQERFFNMFKGAYRRSIPFGKRIFVWPSMSLHIFELKQGELHELKLKVSAKYQDRKPYLAYITKDGHIWLMCKGGGILAFTLEGEPLYGGNLIFSDYLFSGLLEDREGNIWFPTLGEGILFIPNREHLEFPNLFSNEEQSFTDITADKKGNVYFLNDKGGIFRLKEEMKKIREVSKVPEFIGLTQDENHLIIGFGDCIDLEGNPCPGLDLPYLIKDYCHVDGSTYLFSTYDGVVFSEFPISKSEYKHFLLDFEKTHRRSGNRKYWHLGDRSRILSVYFDSTQNAVWTGSMKGLFRISADNQEEFLDGDVQITAANIIGYKNEMWIATPNNGILKIVEDSIDFRLNSQNGLASDQIKKIQIQGDSLYISHNQGLQIYDIISGEFFKINESKGLLSKRVSDFTLEGNNLWTVSKKGLQKFPLESLHKNEIAPIIEIQSIWVNDQEIMDKNPVFTYDQNQFEFRFVGKAFSHIREMHYEYMLEGVDNRWQRVSFQNNSVRYPSVPSGDFRFKVKALNEDGFASEIAEYHFEVLPPFWRSWWFYVLSVLAIILIVAIFFLVRINIIKNRLTLQKQLKSSQITAIKAQMNPHFVFNALNSVQDLIMQKELRNANIYLGKFADLMRKTLEYSSKEHIPLNTELEILSLYLDLEKLRFGDELQSDIELDISEEYYESLQIPSMLLQPYVENAIKHGLLHKAGEKKLKIRFYTQGNHLICEIHDNGVGRKRSEKINKRRQLYHRSFASEANKKRIDLINEAAEEQISLTYEDLYEGDLPIGTKVIFGIPIIQN